MIRCSVSLLTGLFLGLVLAAPAAEPPRRRTIVFLGDSLTAGYGLDLSEAYPALIKRKLAEEGRDWEVINAGVSGDTTSGGLARLGWLLRRPVDVLVLALGANDGLRGISAGETRRNLSAIIDRVREKNPGVRVLVAGMQLPPNLGPAYVSEFCEVFPAVAQAQRATLLPFLIEGVAGVPRLNQADQVHPTAEGQRIVAEHVWRALAPLLE